MFVTTDPHRVLRSPLHLGERAADGQLDELLGSLAAEANHETDRRRRRRLDAAYDQLSSAARSMAEPTTASPDESEPRCGSTVARSAPTAAPVPELDVTRIQRWCAARVPQAARHQVRLECELGERDLTIVERRAPWGDDAGAAWTSLPVGRLRYATTAKTWTLYWRDANLRFHLYDRLPPSVHVDALLNELDRDPTRVVWG